MFSQWQPGSNTFRMNNLPKCQICNEHFKLRGSQPYLLPCLHSVCETCVTSTPGGLISCSICQREVNLTETRLQKDVVRQREIFHLTVQHQPSELLCTHEDDGNQAVCWCQECEDFLCEHCQTLHESYKLTKNHTVQDIGDIQPGSLAKEEYCNTHKKYPLHLWDRNCNILICGKCRLRDHSDHDVEDVDEAANTTRTEMEAQKIEVKSIAVNHNSLLEKTRERLSSISESSSCLMNNIGHTFSSLRSLVDQREKELLSARQQDIDQMKSHLTRIMTSSESGYLKCEMTADYIDKVLLYSSKYDLLNLKLTIHDTTQLCNISAPMERTDCHPLPVFSTEGLDKLKTAMAVFGEADPKEAADNRNVTFQETAIQKEPQSDTLKQETNHLESRVRDLEASVSAFKRENSLLKTEGEEKSKELNKSQQENFHLQCTIQRLERSVSDFKEERSQLEMEAKQNYNWYKQANVELKREIQEYDEAYSRQQASLVNIGLSPGANYHLLKTHQGDKSLILQCIDLKLDADRVNTDEVCIDRKGDIVNISEYKYQRRFNRLMKYSGTTSTEPLPCCGFPQYWEVKARVGVDRPLEKNYLVLEIGICGKEEQDKHHCISGPSHSCALTVVHCETHRSICRQVRKCNTYVLCQPYTLPNNPGQSATLHYGVVFDDSRKKVAFLDVTENKVISTLDNVDCQKTLWPMFGVYNRHYASVSMSLVVDHDIVMWDGKKEMIRKSLQ